LGLWLFPLAALVLRSGFLPRFLGIWLIINGLPYLILSFTGVLLPQYKDTVSYFAHPAQFGEVLWKHELTSELVLVAKQCAILDGAIGQVMQIFPPGTGRAQPRDNTSDVGRDGLTATGAKCRYFLRDDRPDRQRTATNVLSCCIIMLGFPALARG
jgi:hypothetical protein